MRKVCQSVVSLTFCFIIWPLPAFAQEQTGLGAQDSERTNTPGINKAHYHLFNPTPRAYLREMSTDRPDKTESAFTVDAGHVQIEGDAFTHTHHRQTRNDADHRVGRYAIGPLNLKVGLLNRVDLQVVLDNYNHVRTEDRVTDSVTKQSGFGDVTSRLKVNLWGNDGGKTAVALMPFIKAPANQDDLGNQAVEGGLILPLAVQLPGGWTMGLMTELDFNEDGDAGGGHAESINSITFGHDIVGKLAGYMEFFSAVSTEADSPWVGTIDLGFTYGLTDNIQLDAGVNLGITDSADDVSTFVGFSIRF
jgi:outer membrane putative beta-barrel porin/alpha-amylase